MTVIRQEIITAFFDYLQNPKTDLNKSSFQKEMHFISLFMVEKNVPQGNEIYEMIKSNFSLVELIKLLSSKETSKLILRILSYLIIINNENIRLIYKANALFNIALCTQSSDAESKIMATIILLSLLELPETREFYLSHGLPALIPLLEDKDEQQRMVTFNSLQRLFWIIRESSFLIPRYLTEINTKSINEQNAKILISLSLNAIQRKHQSQENIECSLLDNNIIALIDFFINTAMEPEMQYIDIIPALNECLKNNNDKIIKKATEALAVLSSKRKERNNNETNGQQTSINKRVRPASTEPNKKTTTSAAFFQPKNTEWEWESEQQLLELMLSNTAKYHGYDKVNVLGDGNCFFHAVSFHLVQNPQLLTNVSREAQFLRLLALDYIAQNRSEYEPKFSDGSFDNYLIEAQSHLYWADEHLINALSRKLKLNLIIYSTNMNGIPLIYKQQEALSAVLLLNINNVHFYATQKNSSITPRGSLEELLNNAPEDPFTATNTSMIAQSRL